VWSVRLIGEAVRGSLVLGCSSGLQWVSLLSGHRFRRRGTAVTGASIRDRAVGVLLFLCGVRTGLYQTSTAPVPVTYYIRLPTRSITDKRYVPLHCPHLTTTVIHEIKIKIPYYKPVTFLNLLILHYIRSLAPLSPLSPLSTSSSGLIIATEKSK